MLPRLEGDAMPSNIDLIVTHCRIYELAIDCGLGSAPMKLLRAMLYKADKEHFMRHAELVAWPSYKEIRSLSGLGVGSINWARRRRGAQGAAA
jgi:hypothetical protein